MDVNQEYLVQCRAINLHQIYSINSLEKEKVTKKGTDSSKTKLEYVKKLILLMVWY